MAHAIPTTMPHPIWSLLRRLPPDDPSSDAAVLRRFDLTRDETAFELLVWRHGGLVMGVCRRMLRDEHLAEDAFQATFLILARKAGAVRGSLAGWLHQVARRVCLKARKKNPIPRELGSDREAACDADPLLSSELRTVLDYEISRLPEKPRLAVVLCYLQGRSTEDTAKLLGIPRGTVLSRLSSAREHLQRALTRRGVAVPATLFAGTMAAPDLTAEVCRRVTTTAVAFLHSQVIPTVSTQLAHEVLGMTARKAILGTAAALVLTAGLGTGVGLVMAQQGGGKTPATGAKPAAKAPQDELPQESQSETRKRLIEQRDNRLRELIKSQERVSDEIRELEHRRLKMVSDAGSDVDPQALLKRLDEIDQMILSKEDTIAAMPKGIEDLEKWVKDAKAGRFVGQEKRMLEMVDTQVRSRSEVQLAENLYSNLSEQVQQLKRVFGEESPALKEAEKKRDAAKEDIKKAREAVRPGIEKSIGERLVQEAEANLKHDREQFEQVKKSLGEVRNKRREWVIRIQQSKAKTNAQQLIDDEIQVLREIRKQVMRDRLMLEMGLDDKAK